MKRKYSYKSIYYIIKKYFHTNSELVLDRFKSLIKEGIKRYYNLQKKDEKGNIKSNKYKPYTTRTNKIDNKYYNIIIDSGDKEYTNQQHLKFESYILTKNQSISGLVKYIMAIKGIRTIRILTIINGEVK